MAGETLQKYAEGDGECCIGPPIEENAGTVLVISFVSVVAIISVIAAFLFARNCWILRNVSNRKPSRIEREEVEILPCFIFKRAYLNTKRITETCAICLEDYQDGETLRLLPCLHGICVSFSIQFHNILSFVMNKYTLNVNPSCEIFIMVDK
ncbi:E3 ubiquitin-protein ligase ATL31 [Dendrobium catenatum]|uniref:E3 ubiquitin-protein ligase ATL31 n=2 Tax=Dendrobium catenatum TaxID=906689 RepID=A0A2I0VG06_9ASPA|nr:E3 ubiquitin-protein ligase ATL31 [Dendrobium catenatum]